MPTASKLQTRFMERYSDAVSMSSQISPLSACQGSFLHLKSTCFLVVRLSTITLLTTTLLSIMASCGRYHLLSMCAMFTSFLEAVTIAPSLRLDAKLDALSNYYCVKCLLLSSDHTVPWYRGIPHC